MSPLIVPSSAGTNKAMGGGEEGRVSRSNFNTHWHCTESFPFLIIIEGAPLTLMVTCRQSPYTQLLASYSCLLADVFWRLKSMPLGNEAPRVTLGQGDIGIGE